MRSSIETEPNEANRAAIRRELAMFGRNTETVGRQAVRETIQVADIDSYEPAPAAGPRELEEQKFFRQRDPYLA